MADTRRIYAKHEPYTNGHLGKVLDEMKLTGPPTIRCMKYRDGLFALEGSHRICAAHELGLIPKVVILKEDALGLDDYWQAIVDKLPSYDFDHLLVLDFPKFEEELQERDQAKQEVGY